MADSPQKFNRRSFLGAGILGGAAASIMALMPSRARACLECATDKVPSLHPLNYTRLQGDHLIPVSASGIMPTSKEGKGANAGAMDPHKFLTTFDRGKVTKVEKSSDTPNGVLREFSVYAEDKDLDVGGGIILPAWVYNGFMPGPTLRATEGDRIKVHFENRGSMPHTIHFHGIHPADMDGFFERVLPGQRFVYEFVAEPFGLFPYHCHVLPLRKHVSRGLFGTLIIDPKTPRSPAKEMIMVMHGLDVNLDMQNEFYAVNGEINTYFYKPIEIGLGENIRIYLSNMTEFDLVNNFHLHANMFNYFPNGTTLQPAEFTDTINLCQGQRGIVEFSYKYPGKYLFHAHTAEFAELGWVGFFDVKDRGSA